MATACLMPETGTTTSVRSGVSSDMRRRSSFLASNKKLMGPVKETLSQRITLIQLDTKKIHLLIYGK